MKPIPFRIIVILLICLNLTVAEPAGSIMGQQKTGRPPRILIDASKDGGLWWFPQGQPFDPGQDHQGKTLADSLRRGGAEVTELARGEVITADKLGSADVVIKIPGYFPYTPNEVRAYRESVAAGTRLLIAGGGSEKEDAVTKIFGLRFEKLSRFDTVKTWKQHPFSTDIELQALTWSSVVALPKEAVSLAWLSSGEANARPVLGYFPFGKGYVVFVGQTLISPSTDRPFSAKLINSLARYSLDELQRLPSSEIFFADESQGDAPLLIEPKANALLPQPEDGEWRFDWEDVPDAVAYELVVLGPFASFPLIQTTTDKSEYTAGIQSGSYIAGRNLNGWNCRVRARYKNGTWGPWSRVRRFNIKPRSQFVKSVIAENFTASNDHGDRLEIIDFAPKLPATLTVGNQLNIKIAYRLNSTTNCRIWVRPYTNGKRTPGYFAHPSPLYKNGSGELLGFFGFNQPSHVEQVRVRISCDGRSILVLTADIDTNWSN